MAWLSGWDQRIKLDIDYTNKIGASVTQFPITIFLGAGNGETTKVFDEITTNNLKMAITTSDGETQMYGEIEKWDNGSQIGIIHTSLAGWTISANTSIYLYYDNDHADNSTYIGVINSAAGATVWNANFVGVWHLAQDPSGTAPQILDSTSNDNDGTSGGTMTSADLVDTNIGKGIDFDGTDDHIKQTLPAEMKSANVFLEAVLTIDVDNASQIVLNSSPRGSHADGRGVALIINSTAKTFLRKGHGTGSWVTTTGATSVTTATPHYIAAGFDGSNRKVYLNGVEDATDADTTAIEWADRTGVEDYPNPAQLYFSADKSNEVGNGATVPSGGYVNGIIDELRYSDTARAAAWIKGTYNSLMDGLLTYGTEELPLNYYTMAVTVGGFTLTGIAASLLRGYTIACAVGVFVLTGIDTSFLRPIRNMAVTVGEFALTGIDTAFTKALSIIASVGSFTLTGITTGFVKGISIVVSVGQFVLTGIATLFHGRGDWIWSGITKNISDWTNESKNTSDWTGESKNDASWTNEDKN